MGEASGIGASRAPDVAKAPPVRSVEVEGEGAHGAPEDAAGQGVVQVVLVELGLPPLLDVRLELLLGDVLEVAHLLLDLFVDLGKAEAMMPSKEQVPGEEYAPGERIRCLLMSIDSTSRCC